MTSHQPRCFQRPSVGILPIDVVPGCRFADEECGIKLSVFVGIAGGRRPTDQLAPEWGWHPLEGQAQRQGRRESGSSQLHDYAEPDLTSFTPLHFHLRSAATLPRLSNSTEYNGVHLSFWREHDYRSQIFQARRTGKQPKRVPEFRSLAQCRKHSRTGYPHFQDTGTKISIHV